MVSSKETSKKTRKRPSVPDEDPPLRNTKDPKTEPVTSVKANNVISKNSSYIPRSAFSFFHRPLIQSQNVVMPILSRGSLCTSMNMDRRIETVSSSIVKNLDFYNSFKPFANRITCIRWIPKRPYSLLIGGKGGEHYFVPNVNFKATFDDEISENCRMVSEGIGPGGEIREMRIDEFNNHCFYSLNVSGELVKVDIDRGDKTVIQPMGNYDYWYSGLYVHSKKRLIFAGDNKGNIHVLPDVTRDGDGVRDKFKCHKGKVGDIEFHPINENMMATCDSGEHVVKVWDIRKINSFSCIDSLPHARPPNSCYFNSDGSLLLTTDQGQEVRLYSTITWKMVQKIIHPHRHFQHLSPIRAEWHPLADLIVIGRYPDDKVFANDYKSVDFYDYRDGKEIVRLESPNDKICLLNRFNDTGEILASMQQSGILIWKPKSHKILSQGQTKSLMSAGEPESSITDQSKKPKTKRAPRKKPPSRLTKKDLKEESDDEITKLKLAVKAMAKTRGKGRQKAPAKSKKKFSSSSSESDEPEPTISGKGRKKTKQKPKKEPSSESESDFEEPSKTKGKKKETKSKSRR